MLLVKLLDLMQKYLLKADSGRKRCRSIDLQTASNGAVGSLGLHT